MRPRPERRTRRSHRFIGQREPVAAAGDGGDRVRPEQLAQAADLHLQVVLLHHQARPHHVEQFVLGHHAVAPFVQRQQQVEGTRAEGGRLAAHEQLALGGADLDGPRRVSSGMAVVRSGMAAVCAANSRARRGPAAEQRRFKHV
jgi:hypothetical protein